MLTSVVIKSADSLSSITVNDATYPLNVFNWNQTMVGDNLRRMDGPGRHFNQKYPETLPVHMEGHILADTTSAYWTARKALLNIVVPNFDQPLTIHGTINIQLDGDSETYFTRVALVDWDVPLEAFYPTVTPFMFQWESFDGYWLKLSSFLSAKI
jgi:hypothetical protein